jgi:heat-inducible transcriptional repressor
MNTEQLPELGERQRDLLRAVIREYIATAQPVASATLVRQYRLDVSSATVRNELAALEELGLLTHPHTSAGRVPTDLGYRYFIESLMALPGLLPDEQLTVSHQFQQALSNTSEWLRLAASTLARLTTEAAIVTPPATSNATLRHVEVVPISDRRALLVVVFEGGAVAQQLLELRSATTPEHLRSLSARLTETLATRDATAVRSAAVSESGVDAEVTSAIVRALEEHDATRTHAIYTDGIQNILAQPEFAAGGRMRDMLRLLEDRTSLFELLPPTLGGDEVHVAIGSEHRLEPLRGCSLVFGRYGSGTAFLGYVGVVGPTRMDYARSIGAVRYVGSLMSDLVRVMEGH